jgi:transposase
VRSALVERGAVPADVDGLARLVHRLSGHDSEVFAVVESMNGARFVHDQLELAGFDVDIADAQRVKGLAPLACKTDRIDAWVLAELARRDLVPAIWLPDPAVRAERERARFRLHLVRQRTRLKNRIHATLIGHGHACPTSDLFGVSGRALLERLAIPEPWRGTLEASLRLIDGLDEEISRLRTRAAPPRRRPSLRPPAHHLPRDRLGARLHDRGRARRHRPSPARASSPATPDSAPASINPASATAAAR